MKYTTISDISLSTILKSWSEIGKVKATVKEEDGIVIKKEVDLRTLSGIEMYSTTVTLPKTWKQQNGYLC
ncbi:hypothetical protein [Halalkalibacter urbisdiaboli]|uniref:hypothetical protein n=1 Tax=Halalkalibacter urbisdiaboli TaxID=1960589 RepID=UPI000B43DBF5|nr:hypothetical protein [Halalkalibacter urbisdiaboli]